MIFRRFRNRGAHRAQAQERARRWQRKVLGLPVAAWLVIVLGGVAVAVIGLIVNLGTSGTITTAEDKIDVRYVVGSPIMATAVGGPGFTCTASIVSATELRITMNEVAQGDHCNIGNFAVQNLGPATARLNGFNLESPGFAGGAVVATVNTCGRTIEPGTQGDIGFRITIGAVTSGQTFSFNPAVDGLDWRAAAHYVPGECTQTP